MILLGTEGKGISWQDIETLTYPGSKPLVKLHGGAQSEAKKLGIKEVAVRQANFRDYAVANVIGST